MLELKEEVLTDIRIKSHSRSISKVDSKSGDDRNQESLLKKYNLLKHERQVMESKFAKEK